MSFSFIIPAAVQDFLVSSFFINSAGRWRSKSTKIRISVGRRLADDDCWPRQMSNQQKCAVCAAEKAHSHYGGLACASCRVFFIRAVQRLKPYACKADDSCLISYEKIKKCCKACRYTKCQAANMSVDAVGQQKREREECSMAVVPYFDAEKIKRIVVMPAELFGRRVASLQTTVRQSISVGFNLADDLKKCSEAVQFANTLVLLERFCENNSGQSPTKVACNLDVSLVDVLQYPELCCERIPVSLLFSAFGRDLHGNWPFVRLRDLLLSPGPNHPARVNWDHHHATDTMANFLHLAYCRFTTQFVDFISAASELNELSSREKLRLLSSNFCDVGILTILYNGWLQNFREGLVFPFGYHFVPKKDDNDEMNVFFRKLISFLQEHVLPIMDELQLTVQEYVVLKMIALFSTSVSLSDAAAETVRRAKNRYERVLICYIQEVYTNFPESWRLNRIKKLFAMLRELRIAAIFDGQMLARMVLLDIGQMRGNLPFDMHVRDF